MSKRPTIWNKTFSRRAFLGGAGAMVALPFLESLLTPFASQVARAAASDGNAACKRLVFFYVPNGIHMANWTPSTTGSDYALPRILSPLGDLRSELLVLTGLKNDPARPDGPGDHAAGTGSFLTCTHVRKTDGDNILNGISVDQVAANALVGQTLLSSLELGIDGGASLGGCDSGYSCAYSRNISWAGPQTPRPKVVAPRLVFNRLFQGFDVTQTAVQRALRTKHRKSVLDYVREDAKRLIGRVSASDRHKLDEYLTGVFELERRIDTITEDTTCSVPARPERGLPIQEHVDAMVELMVVAMQCDLTRVVTFMLGNAGSGRSYTFVDPSVTDGHHGISHHGMDPENHRKLTIIDRWEVAQYAALVRRMSQVTEANGQTLLDNSLVFFSSEIEDGDRHRHSNLPVLLAGRGGGLVQPGQHIRFPNQDPIANLYITMLRSVGVETQTFGETGTGVLPSLLA
ncbi:MAG: hypothetical protein ACI9MR_000263 [Myxococcota bacterium]|jgi:hypothetical protein